MVKGNMGYEPTPGERFAMECGRDRKMAKFTWHAGHRRNFEGPTISLC